MISVDFDATVQLLIIYSACQILESKLEYNEAVLHLFIEFKKVYDSFRREVLCNVLIWYPHETGQANNNVSE